ncbi:efflux RND transporter periplasmic adaptor subunit [Robbsia sp. KACC 23696]|uniref:efflux RND transporter periplasmic adaptor subunit n=1 Tax=Robbsia sp. KACC 23696 TaxID=3149231 RepID=UPI00325B8A0D
MQQRSKKATQRRARHRAVFATCVALSAAVAATLSGCGKSASPENADANQHAAPNVTVQTVQPRAIALVDTLSGRLSAVEDADVRPQVDGVVQKRLFTEGATVKAGQPLYQLDAASYQATYDTARGTLLKAEATAHAADLTAQRYQALLKINGVSQQDVENYVAAAREADADVIADRGTLESARVNLTRTRIVAPISGRIGKSSVTAGALVTADQTTALATIQSIDNMYLDVTRSSADGLRLRKAIAAGRITPASAAVTLMTEDGATYPIKGTLQFSDISVDTTTGSVTLRSVFPNPQHELLPGMFVSATFSEGTQQNALLVPQAIVSRGSGGLSTVLVVDGNNKVASRTVTADSAYGNQWIVTKGLQAGDRVIVDGLQSLSAGMTVTPVEQQATAANATAASSATAAPASAASASATAQ